MKRAMKRLLIAAALVSAAACGAERDVTGPLTGANGRVTFTPTPDVRLRGVTIRKQEPASPNDNRWIPGSGFWFDPGKVPDRTEYPGDSLGTITVDYSGLTLPAGTKQDSLFLAQWDGEKWLRLDGAVVDVSRRVVVTPVPRWPVRAQYALLRPEGTSVLVALGQRFIGGDSVLVHAWVGSNVISERVTAYLGGKSAALTFHDNVPRFQPSNPNWRGWLSIAGVRPGDYLLRVTATQADGREVSDTMSLSIDRPPVVTVLEPQRDDWVPQRFRIRASCADDDPAPCIGIYIEVSRFGYHNPPRKRIAAVDGVTFDGMVDLGGTTGVLNIHVVGVAASGKTGETAVKVGSR